MKTAEATLKLLRKAIEISLFFSVFLLIYQQNWEVLAFTLLAFVLIEFSKFMFKRKKVNLPLEFEMVITLFIYCSFFLGEANNFYSKFPWWDLMLHTFSGIILGLSGFLYLYLFWKTKRLKASPFFIGLFTFAFAMAIGGVWEIFEFGFDNIFHGGDYVMQAGGLRDTMGDLIVDAIGALLAAVWGYNYIKGNIENEGFRIRKYIISRFEEKNKDLFEKTKTREL